MTDLATAPRAGKRERLVEAARGLFYHRGVEGTTLADIAAAADVPLGNVYYYFKAKDDIVRAVIDAHTDQLRETLRTFERHRSPRARLLAFTREVASTAPTTARWGCPHGTLCTELDKRGGDLAEAAGKLMRLRVDWTTDQFRQMGRKDAANLAITLNAGIQGATQLANAYHDPDVLTGQARHLQRWINSLA
jgi:TetR/AcrR family transcriptional regulator, transcriptional repressor for nem operon